MAEACQAASSDVSSGQLLPNRLHHDSRLPQVPLNAALVVLSVLLIIYSAYDFTLFFGSLAHLKSAAMDVPEPEQTPFTAVSAQTSRIARVCCQLLDIPNRLEGETQRIHG